MANSATPNGKSSDSTPAGPPIPQREEGQNDQIFDTVLRGYDRRQVDDALSTRNKEITRLKVRLAEANRQHQLTAESAERTQSELRELRARTANGEPSVPEDSFGFRAEKLLRLAEQEATEMRNSASRESAGILEKARTDAEKHRHDIEQSLIARASLLEQQSSQRSAELQEREQQIADQLAAARQQAEHMHTAAEQAALRLRKEAEAAADDTRQRAESDIRRQRDQSTQELARLSGLQSDVRSELSRLSDVLSAEVAKALSKVDPEATDNAKNASSSTSQKQAASSGSNG
ncbi:hypothetical protein PZ938_03575 [Luteipulveratus sp. YIM 133132]|uniref:Cell division protein DivIVA n=1 Tax=Luteipulveratus flavus TaxID=3031728 RepID=A0ABT6C1R0_9MICO|nr:MULTISPECIES: hypothetical protein [unclassified Luteipulveratus]MDE9364673.1 hypothetical protein [Luteipulveratus sp. YIM 133132]MDF8262833.1 hypothetical protein [Luteipulveratus sp. YIM 133296]